MMPGFIDSYSTINNKSWKLWLKKKLKIFLTSSKQFLISLCVSPMRPSNQVDTRGVCSFIYSI